MIRSAHRIASPMVQIVAGTCASLPYWASFRAARILAAIKSTACALIHVQKFISFALYSPLSFSAHNAESERNQPRQLANMPARVILFSFQYFCSFLQPLGGG